MALSLSGIGNFFKKPAVTHIIALAAGLLASHAGNVGKIATIVQFLFGGGQ